jgi:hypothetical protein
MSIRLLLPCPPALAGGSAFAHYNQAVHSNSKFLYLLSIATNEQHGYEFNGNESDNDVKENPVAPPLPNCFSPVTAIPGGKNLKACSSQPVTCLTTNFLSCSLVVVNMSYSPMALAYQ